VGLFDNSDEHPPAKAMRYVITGIAFVLLVAGFCYFYLLRYHTEKNTVRHFMNALIAGNTQEAYQVSKPAASYSFKDFEDDWGPQAYNGGIKSFRIEDATRLESGAGVAVTVEVSPYAPFPPKSDELKSAKTTEVKLWVQFKDESIGLAPF
jgi:hypothetical protein